MLNFVALVWNPSDGPSCEAVKIMIDSFHARSPQWNQVLNAPGLYVSCYIEALPTINATYLLQGNRGVVMGRLFRRNYEAGNVPEAITFDTRLSESIVTSGGRKLLECYWGQYVAFLRDDRSETVYILRDPTGRIPCYTARVERIDVYFRRLEDYERLGHRSLSIDQRGLLGHLAFMTPCSRITAVSGISVLLAGECISRRQEARKKIFLWNPLEFCNGETIEDCMQAQDLIRRSVRACVHAWASCFDDILLSLSGGLDSSIVASCLVDAPCRPRVVCENVYCRSGSNEDERQFARLVAQRMGYQLIESELKADFRFRAPSRLPRTTDPFRFANFVYKGALCSETTSSNRSMAMFTGLGGDELFFRSGRLPTFADRLYRHGILGFSLSVATQDSLVDHVALWRVIRKAILYGLFKRSWNCRVDFSKQFFAPDVADELVQPEILEQAAHDNLLFHPLYVNAIKGVPPGKIYQCFLISLATHRGHVPATQTTPTVPIEVDPLMSQPLIELCLRIPLDVLRKGGQDRALVRRAFRMELPQRIVDRQSKGGGNEELQAALARNIGFVRERLLEGYLLKQGYLNRSALEKALDLGTPTRIRTSSLRILQHLTTEIWCSNFLATS